MNDMSPVIVAKSDQLNADDLISGARIITIREVSISAGTEQPVSIYFDGDNGKPWKPCKTMSRVLVGAWGPDAKAYVGRSLRLYREPSVTWGGMQVGGIRISHMSDIQGDLVMALMASNKKKAVATIKPLPQQQPKQPAADPATKWADAYVAKLATLATVEAVRAFEAEKAAKLAELKTKRADLHQSIVAAVESRIAELSDFSDDDFSSPSSPAGTPTAEAGPTHTDGDAGAVQEGLPDEERGEAHNGAGAEASAWIDRYEAACAAAPDRDALDLVHAEADEGAARIRREFPDLYVARLSSIRPAGSPETAAASDMFGGK